MKNKYAIHPGYILSKNDGDKHYITFASLVRLYDVDPRDAYLWDDYRPETYLGRKKEDYIHLYPKNNYATVERNKDVK